MLELLICYESSTRLETRTKESNVYASLWVVKTRGRSESNWWDFHISIKKGKKCITGRSLAKQLSEGTESEHIRWDPKDGELFLSRVKPGETLVEARSGTDVQIVRQTWV